MCLFCTLFAGGSGVYRAESRGDSRVGGNRASNQPKCNACLTFKPDGSSSSPFPSPLSFPLFSTNHQSWREGGREGVMDSFSEPQVDSPIVLPSGPCSNLCRRHVPTTRARFGATWITHLRAVTPHQRTIPDLQSSYTPRNQMDQNEPKL